MNTLDEPVFVEDVHRWYQPLGHLLQVVHRRTVGPWAPLWLSTAAREMADTAPLLRSDGSPWGDAPLGSAYTAAAMLLATAVQHADAAHRLLASSPASGLALDTLTRGALEAAAQASWLLDPSVTGRLRVARLYALRRASAVALEDKTVPRLGLTSARGYGAQVADLDQLYNTTLGLTVRLGPKGGWADCEGQKLGNYGDRVKDFMAGIGIDPAAGPYAYYCGASHAELWRIQESYRENVTANGTVLLVPYAPRTLVHTALTSCALAVSAPAARALKIMGRTAGATELEHSLDQVRTRLTL